MATQLMAKHRRLSKSDRNLLLTKAARNKENQDKGVFDFKARRVSKIRLRLNWNQEMFYYAQFGSPEMYHNYHGSPSGYCSPDLGHYCYCCNYCGITSADCDDMMIDY